jgi:RNA-directed DNA polymerase
MPLGNRAETDPVSGAKASPLLSGLSSRESMTNRPQDAKQMKTEQSVGAAFGIPSHWREIDWRSVSGDVRRLQVRIVKAVETGRWGKVKALQRLLTTSRSGKLLAVRRVTENQGRKTPGVDGESWDTPEKKMAAVDMLRGRGYRPLPLRRIYIPKSNGKLRPLGIPTMKDRAMQALHLLALDPVAETTADEDSYGFRQKRRCADAIDACAIALRRKGCSPWVLEGDIRGCFDNISHDWLLAHVPMDRVILRKWLKAGYMEKQVLHATEQGTPQGGIISPVLANLALDGFERRLRERYPVRGKGSENGRKAKVHLIRYADDFIITGRTKELLEDEVKPLVESFLRERGLELSAEKTKITHIEEGFDFLGQNLRRYSHGKLWIKPSKKNIHTFLEKVRSLVKKSLHAPAWRLITELNRMIRGWALYHRHVKSKRIFSSVDQAIFISLWRWALRRHPRKGKRWLMRRYFARRGGRSWCFFGSRRKKDGTKEVVWLFHATSLPFSIYTKVRRASNPYHPAWEMYFEERESRHMAHTLAGRAILLYLWRTQGGKCPACGLPISRETGWHSHHVIPKVLGGHDGATNRQLLHPECHRQLHSRLGRLHRCVSQEAFGRLEPCELETLTHGS